MEKPRFEAIDESFDAAKLLSDLVGTYRKNNKQQEQSKLDEEKSKKRDALEIIPEGVTEMLLPKVHGPFIGEVEDGQTQSGLISNLFVAPIFRYEREIANVLLRLIIFSPLNASLLPFLPRTPHCNPFHPLRDSHEPEPTDFLLIFGKKFHKHHNQASVGSNNLSVTLRPFPSSIFCCGQTGNLDLSALFRYGNTYSCLTLEIIC